jgi:hypothetical protein
MFPFSTLFKVTGTFAKTAPEGSVTVPLISPVVNDWAKVDMLVSRQPANANKTVNSKHRLQVMLPPGNLI